MPELPEVQTISSALAAILIGRRLLAVPHLRQDMLDPITTVLAEHLANRSIIDLHRRAKRIVFCLDSGDRFYIHLGMTGQISTHKQGDEIKKHTHLIIQIDKNQQIRFSDPRRFGKIVWMGKNDHENLGPEPLGLSWKQLKNHLKTARRPIKSALLDQSLIAGIGNIYADEALYRAGIHPLTHACTLTDGQIKALNRSIQTVLNAAIRAGGSTIRDYVGADGKKGGYQQRHRVYDKTNTPCIICNNIIQKIKIAGRSTHFCPNCQPT